MTDPITYGLGVILSSPLIWIGLLLIGGGSLALAWMFREPLGYYEPEIPAVIQPAVEDTLIHPAQPIAPNYYRSGEYPQVPPQAQHIRQHWRREDSDTQVIPSIPGATRPKERTEEEMRATEPELSPVKPADLAPQFAALGRFFAAVDEARADTNEAMDRIAADVRPDCPLSTQEIPPLLDAPLYDTTVRRADTQELSAVMEKVKQP